MKRLERGVERKDAIGEIGMGVVDREKRTASDERETRAVSLNHRPSLFRNFQMCHMFLSVSLKSESHFESLKSQNTKENMGRI